VPLTPRPVPVAPPRFRGRLHQVCFFLAPLAGLLLLVRSEGRASGAVAVYALALSLLYGVSAAYHRGRWSPVGKRRMKRLDHATIFLMIAGTYTPICAVALGDGLSWALLATVWVLAAVGFVLALVGVAERPGVGHALYISLGWLGVLSVPSIAAAVGAGGVALLLAGGLLYTVGAFVLAARWPNPFPTTFGYHEVWHAMVVAASALHYAVVYWVVRPA
jgi:hemolysin III